MLMVSPCLAQMGPGSSCYSVGQAICTHLERDTGSWAHEATKPQVCCLAQVSHPHPTPGSRLGQAGLLRPAPPPLGDEAVSLE